MPIEKCIQIKLNYFYTTNNLDALDRVIYISVCVSKTLSELKFSGMYYSLPNFFEEEPKRYSKQKQKEGNKTVPFFMEKAKTKNGLAT